MDLTYDEVCKIIGKLFLGYEKRLTGQDVLILQVQKNYEELNKENQRLQEQVSNLQQDISASIDNKKENKKEITDGSE